MKLPIVAQPLLGRIRSVDVDIFGGEIGGPETALAEADAKIDVDGKFAVAEIFVRAVLVEVWDTPAVNADLLIAEPDGNPLRLDLRAGVAGGSHQPSPVRIGAGPGGFYQRRVRDGSGDLQRIGVAGCPLDL